MLPVGRDTPGGRDVQDANHIEYSVGGTTFKSHLVRPPEGDAIRGGVLVFPTWKGVEEFARSQASRLANLGYVAMAADVYGEGRVAASDDEAAGLMQGLATNRARLRERGQAALQALAAQEGVASERLAAIGFCFGGMAVLALARSGAPIQAAVSFHGFFNTPDPASPGTVHATIQAHHGALDPLVSMSEVEAFCEEMGAAGADWQVVMHGGAMHGFMNPAAAAPERGVAYDAPAARRAWVMMQDLLQERLAP